MDWFRSAFGYGNRNGGNARHDDFLDPRSGFWGDDANDDPPQQPPQSPFPSPFFSPPGFHGSFHFPPSGPSESQEHPSDPLHPGQGQPFMERDMRQMEEHFDQMFREFSDLFRHMGPVLSPRPGEGTPFFSAPPAIEQAPEANSPRDHMLKQPDRNIQFGGIVEKPHAGTGQDTDLDGKINSVEDLMRQQPPQQQQQQPRSFFRGFSSSKSIQRSGDGSVREEVVKRDSQGNEERTVTESKDGQVTKVSTWKTVNGKTEKIEDGGSHGMLKPESPASQIPALPDSAQPPLSSDVPRAPVFGNMFKWLWKKDD